jgi:hypothetical protein
MLIRIIALLIFFITSFIVSAQNAPELFGEGIISNGGVFGFTLSPDGTQALWVNSNGGRDTLIIMESQFADGHWMSPVPVSFSGNPKWKDIDPLFSPDGKTVLFQSNRPVEGKPDRKGFDIWAAKKLVNGWSEPYHLGNEINTDESESFASITKSGSIYFMKTNPDGKGNSDIYVARLVKGKYQTENVGAPINTTFRESNPFISPDEDFLLYFSSDSTGLGDVDLYITFKNHNGWTTPVNLGAPINSAKAEFCPFYHQKQRRLYFARQHKEGNRFIENIYSVPLNIRHYKNRSLPN